MMRVHIDAIDEIGPGQTKLGAQLKFDSHAEAKQFYGIAQCAVPTIIVTGVPVKSSLHKRRLIDLVEAIEATIENYAKKPAPLGLGGDLQKHCLMLKAIIQDYQDD